MTAPYDPQGNPNNPGQPNPYGQPGFPPPGAGYPPPPPNPYGAPGQPAWGSPAGGQPGGLWIRWGARIIDGILVSIVAWVLAAAFGATSNIMVTGLFSGVLMFGYFVALEVSQGRTLGRVP